MLASAAQTLMFIQIIWRFCSNVNTAWGMRFYISNQPPDDTSNNRIVALAEHRGPTTDRPSESEFQQYS